MKLALKWLADFILALAVLALLILFLIPWSNKNITAASDSGRSPAPAQPAVADSSRRVNLPPRQVASLFGWREKEPAQQAVPREAPLPEAAWLKPVGFVDREGWGRIYIFKDGRSGDMLSLTAGSSAGGYKLLEVRAKEFVLELEGKRYLLKRALETR
jgi:hypothetical protein